MAVTPQQATQPIQSADTQSSFVQCPFCRNYEPNGTTRCSKCHALLVAYPNNDSRTINWVHKGKLHGLLAVVCLHIFAIFCIICVYFSSWFIRMPLDNLSVNYYMDHAEYNINIQSFDTIQYSQCNDSEFNGEDCDNMTDIANIITPLWFTSFILLTLMTIFSAVILLPHYIHSCANNNTLLKFSNAKNIDISLSILLFCSFILCGITFSAFTEFIRSFPYKKYCFYNEYDNDSNIGCYYGYGLNLTIIAHVVIVHGTLFMSILLITHRNKSIITDNSSKPISNTNLLQEGAVHVNYNDLSSQQNQQPTRQYWIVFFVFFGCAALIFFIYSICIFKLYVPSADDGAMEYITNRWKTEQCFQPQNKTVLNSGYYEYAVGFDFSFQDVCSFTYPNETSYEYFPEWYSCCKPETCSYAFNYTDLTPYDDNMLCLHALSVITKASCHPLAAKFTPKKYNIKNQSNITEENGVFVCVLYCEQTWNYCKDMRWYNNETKKVRDLFTDSMDFCKNGLQVQVRSEAFTDKCLDGAYSNFNVYLFMVFMITSVFVAQY